MPETTARRGLVGAAALLLTLVGTVLWLSIIQAPWDLASGLLEARSQLQLAEKDIERGAFKSARNRAFFADAAIERASAAVDSGSPALVAARRLPEIGPALEEVPHLVQAASHSADAVKGTLAIALEALRGPNRIIAKDEDGSTVRIDRVKELAATVETIRHDLDLARQELEAVDASKLPQRFRPQIRQGIARAEKADVVLADAQAGLAVLPGFLGDEEPRNYLIGMMNSAEQRGTGGAMLQFAILSATDGRFDMVPAQTVYQVDEDRRQFDIPLPEDAWYVRAIEDAHRFGNANWSPDWPLSSQVTLGYARASNPTFPKIDGVIGVDPIAMQYLMPGTGPFTTKKSGNRISSRRVVHFLLYKAYASYPIPAHRRDVLQQVVDGFYARLLDPLHPSELVRGLGEALAEKHMQIWMKRPQEQEFVERMDWDGAIRAAKKSDYLYVVEQNVGGNKLDYFDDQATTMDVKVDGRDAIVATRLSIDNRVFLPQPRWSMGDNGPWHRPMLNVYVPGDAQLLAVDSPEPCTSTSLSADVCRRDSPSPAVWSDGQPATHTERGKKVWSATLEIPPQAQGSVSFDYRSPGVVSGTKRRTYRLVLQHQPRVRPERVTVRLQLPDGAQDVDAKGWKRDGDVLLWEQELVKDTVLEVSWRK